MPYHPHLIHAIAQDRHDRWRQEAAEDRRALAATRRAEPAAGAASTPDPADRGRGLTFHALYRRLTGGLVRP